MVEAGLTTIADLQELPEEALVARFGKFGRRLAHLVQGDDPRRVMPDRETKSVSTENTFARDLKAYEPLAAELTDLAEQLAARLPSGRSSPAAPSCSSSRPAISRISTRQTRLAHPTRRADVILDAGLTLLRREIGTRAYRLIGIGVADVAPAAEADPPDLFGDVE